MRRNSRGQPNSPQGEGRRLDTGVAARIILEFGRVRKHAQVICAKSNDSRRFILRTLRMEVLELVYTAGTSSTDM